MRLARFQYRQLANRVLRRWLAATTDTCTYLARRRSKARVPLVLPDLNHRGCL